MAPLHDDPFTWNVERVIKELCTPERSFPGHLASKLTDPEMLAPKLREQGVDGESLLTYEDVSPHSVDRFLSHDLGLKKLPHRLSVIKVIHYLKLNSRGYKAWKREWTADDDDVVTNYATPGSDYHDALSQRVPDKDELTADDEIAKASLIKKPAVMEVPTPASSHTAGEADTEMTRPESSRAAGETESDAETSRPMSPHPTSPLGKKRKLDLPILTISTGDNADAKIPRPVSPRPTSPAPKKRRLALTSLTTTDKTASKDLMMSAFDVAEVHAGELDFSELDKMNESYTTTSFALDGFVGDARGYLGRGALVPKNIANSRFASDAVMAFAQSQPTLFPLGRRLQVNRAMIRHHLRGPARLENDEASENSDELLPVFGESDGEDDSETFREIEEEQREEEEARRREEERLANLKHLGLAEVEAVVKRVIDGFHASWEIHKKPKLDHNAWKLWNRARREGSRRAQINRALKDAQHLETRLAKQKDVILGMEWTDAAEVEAQCNVFDLTVSNIAEKQWLVQLLQNPVRPPRPETIVRPRTRASKPTVKYEDGNEILESEPSDMDDFIVDDEAAGSTLKDDDDGFYDQEPAQTSWHADSPEDRAAPESKEAEPMVPVVQDMVDEAGQEPAEEGAMDVDHDDDHVSPGEKKLADKAVSVSMSIDDEGDEKKIQPQDEIVVTPASRHVTDSPLSPVDAIRRKLFRTPGGQEMVLRSPATGTASKPISLLDSCPGTPSVSVPGSQDLSNSQGLLPGLHEVDELSQRLEEWEKTKDRKRLTVGILAKWKASKRGLVLQAVEKYESELLWDEFIIKRTLDGARSQQAEAFSQRAEMEAILNNTAFGLSKLFYCHSRCKSAQAVQREKEALRSKALAKIGDNKAGFGDFCGFVKSIVAHFPDHVEESGVILELPTADDEFSGLYDDALGSNDDDTTATSPRKTRKRGPRNLETAKRQLTQLNQQQEFEKRRVLLQQKLKQDSVPGDRARFVINVLQASDAMGCVYVDEKIAGKIKDYQIQGVQFMWNLVVASDEGEGCLLAHTMGLGKTMQVITLLVAIAEASNSADASVRNQVPEQLRESKTLVLCPAGLVQNWIDELLIWTPKDALGRLMAIHAEMSHKERLEMAQDWEAHGGVLVIGYTLIRSLTSDADRPELKKLFLQTPNLVVADEAHAFKNPKSQISLLVSKFRTKSRIALTGSPLSNDPSDYYAMINWISPRFLGDESEFNAMYAIAIKEGFYRDSTTSQKRKALTCLDALKKLLKPKAHRRDHGALAGQLTNKREFLIDVPLTELQEKAYRVFVTALRNSSNMDELAKSQAQIWAFCATLSALLAHPLLFRHKLQQAREANSSKSAGGSKATADADGDTEAATLSNDLVGQVLAVLPERRLDDYNLSNKVRLLLRILDESKKVGDKVLVFSHSLPTLDYLSNIMGRQKRVYYRLDGQTKVSGRQSKIKEFNVSEQAEVYLISTRAGGVGLNMYGANRVVIFDFKFVPTDEQQAIGRAYRIGQTKPVFVYWLICAGTFESVIQNKSIFKKQLASRVVDQKNPVAWAKRLGDYFQMPEDPPQEDLSSKRGQDKVLDALLGSEDLVGLIRDVQSTDTFEQEENAELTAEEQKVADSMLERSRGAGLGGVANSACMLPTLDHQPVQAGQFPSMEATLSELELDSISEPESAAALSEDSKLTPKIGIKRTASTAPYGICTGHGPPSPTLGPSKQTLASTSNQPMQWHADVKTFDFYGSLPGYPSPPKAAAASLPTPARQQPQPHSPSPSRQKANPSTPSRQKANPPAPHRRQPDPDLKRSDFSGNLTSALHDLEQSFETHLAVLRRDKVPAKYDAKAASNLCDQALNMRGEDGLPRFDYLNTVLKLVKEKAPFAQDILQGRVTADFIAGKNSTAFKNWVLNSYEPDQSADSNNKKTPQSKALEAPGSSSKKQSAYGDGGVVGTQSDPEPGSSSSSSKRLSVHGDSGVAGMPDALVPRANNNANVHPWARQAPAASRASLPGLPTSLHGQPRRSLLETLLGPPRRRGRGGNPLMPSRSSKQTSMAAASRAMTPAASKGTTPAAKATPAASAAEANRPLEPGDSSDQPYVID